MLSKSLIQYSIDGCVPSLLFNPGPSYGGGDDNGASFQRPRAGTATLSAPGPAAGQRRPTPPQRRRDPPGHVWVSLLGVAAPFSWVLVHQVLRVPSKSLCPSPV